MDLGLPVGLGPQVLGQLPDGGLGAAHDLGAVARRDEGNLLALRWRCCSWPADHGGDGVDELFSDGVALELGGTAVAVGDEGPAERVVGADPVHGGGHVRRVLRLEQEGGVACGLATAPTSRATIGTPVVIASTRGTPKPSCTESERNTSAAS